MTDPLRTLAPVTIDNTTFFVDEARPVAVLRRTGQPDRMVSWPRLNVGIHHPQTLLHRAGNALWVSYSPWDSTSDERYPALCAPQDMAAVRIGLEGDLGFVQTAGTKILGVTNEGLWTGSSPFQAIDEDYHGGPEPSGYAYPDTLQLHRPGQPPLSIEFDRHLFAVRQRGQSIEMWLNPSPPITHPDQAGGAGYEYRLTRIPLPPLNSIADALRFRDLVPQGWGEPVSEQELEQLEEEYLEPAQGDPGLIDLQGMVGTHWELVELSAVQREQAIAAVADQFSSLEQFWHDSSGEALPLTEGLSDAQCQVVGRWPQVQVVVDFHHPHYPQGILGRSFQVFDEAGRVHLHSYAGINLMEDLDTGDLPEPGQAKDGVLRI